MHPLGRRRRRPQPALGRMQRALSLSLQFFSLSTKAAAEIAMLFYVGALAGAFVVFVGVAVFVAAWAAWSWL